jgi:DNA invertase Pin-like site-specific DNA recombinase
MEPDTVDVERTEDAMTSGRKLTQEQVDAILRLAARRDDAGEFVFTFAEISSRTGLHRTTVANTIRRAAAELARLVCWKSEDFD